MPKTIWIGISSQEHEVTHIRLYPAHEVNQWRQLITQIELPKANLNPALSFIGGPAWLIGSTVVKGVLNASLNHAAQKLVFDNLSKATAMMDQVRADGQMFAIEDIMGAEIPNPKAWVAATKNQDPRSTIRADKALLGAAKIQKKLAAGGSLTSLVKAATERTYIASDDDFVTLRTKEKDLMVRWSAVHSYRLEQTEA